MRRVLTTFGKREGHFGGFRIADRVMHGIKVTAY